MTKAYRPPLCIGFVYIMCYLEGCSVGRTLLRQLWTCVCPPWCRPWNRLPEEPAWPFPAEWPVWMELHQHRPAHDPCASRRFLQCWLSRVQWMNQTLHLSLANSPAAQHRHCNNMMYMHGDSVWMEGQEITVHSCTIQTEMVAWLHLQTPHWPVTHPVPFNVIALVHHKPYLYNMECQCHVLTQRQPWQLLHQGSSACRQRQRGSLQALDMCCQCSSVHLDWPGHRCVPARGNSACMWCGIGEHGRMLHYQTWLYPHVPYMKHQIW